MYLTPTIYPSDNNGIAQAMCLTPTIYLSENNSIAQAIYLTPTIYPSENNSIVQAMYLTLTIYPSDNNGIAQAMNHTPAVHPRTTTASLRHCTSPQQYTLGQQRHRSGNVPHPYNTPLGRFNNGSVQTEGKKWIPLDVC